MPRIAPLLAMVAAAGCSRDLPLQPAEATPAFEIQDATHNLGNPNFGFLLPIALPSRFRAPFDGSAQPVVEICQWQGNACLMPLVVRYTTTTGAGIERIRVELSDQAYGVIWPTSRYPLNVPGIYRIRVLVAGTELGHADAKVVSRVRDLIGIDPRVYVPLLNGAPLPIRFTIRQGAVTVVGASGGTVTAANGQVTLVIPPGAVPGNVGITVTPATTIPAGGPLVPGSAWTFGPEGIAFLHPVQLTIRYDPTRLPAGRTAASLRLHKVVGGVWRPVPGSQVNTAQTSVTGAITGFSSYGAVSFTWSSISAGGYFGFSSTCGISGGHAYCWGNDALGQLGRGPDAGSQSGPNTVPAPVIGGLTFQSVSVNLDTTSTCGVEASGAAYCWGYNSFGQLGDGSTSNNPTPVAVFGGLTFRSVVAGNFHSCGVTIASTAYCWGFGYPDTPTPVGGGLTWQSVSAGIHNCGVAAEGTYCWGDNYLGQLGNGSTNGSQTPVAVTGTFQSVTAGLLHSCGLSAGIANCWGYNDEGQLGVGSNTGPETCDGYGSCSTTPVAVAGGLSFRSLSAGWRHSCGVAVGGAAYCWGANFLSQLGDGSTSDRAAPVPVAGGLTFVQLSAGVSHTCGVTDAGAAYCWGANESGQLGDSSTVNSAVPVEVKIP